MLRDSRIVHIIDLLGELRELLLVIDQAALDSPLEGARFELS